MRVVMCVAVCVAVGVAVCVTVLGSTVMADEDARCVFSNVC